MSRDLLVNAVHRVPQKRAALLVDLPRKLQPLCSMGEIVVHDAPPATIAAFHNGRDKPHVPRTQDPRFQDFERNVGVVAQFYLDDAVTLAARVRLHLRGDQRARWRERLRLHAGQTPRLVRGPNRRHCTGHGDKRKPISQQPFAHTPFEAPASPKGKRSAVEAVE